MMEYKGLEGMVAGYVRSTAIVADERFTAGG